MSELLTRRVAILGMFVVSSMLAVFRVINETGVLIAWSGLATFGIVSVWVATNIRRLALRGDKTALDVLEKANDTSWVDGHRAGADVVKRYGDDKTWIDGFESGFASAWEESKKPES